MSKLRGSAILAYALLAGAFQPVYGGVEMRRLGYRVGPVDLFFNMPPKWKRRKMDLHKRRIKQSKCRVKGRNFMRMQGSFYKVDRFDRELMQ